MATVEALEALEGDSMVEALEEEEAMACEEAGVEAVEDMVMVEVGSEEEEGLDTTVAGEEGEGVVVTRNHCL